MSAGSETTLGRAREILPRQEAIVSGTPERASEGGVEQQLCLWVLIQADPANTENLLIGDDTAQVVTVVPGNSLTLSVDDAGKIWIDAVSGTQNANIVIGR